MPGVARDKLQVKLRESVLVITGEKAALRTAATATEGASAAERSGVSEEALRFEKRLKLPNTEGLTAADVQATYRDGVLRLTVPKPKEVQAQSIDIKDA